jgi:hypothetical protein
MDDVAPDEDTPKTERARRILDQQSSEGGI